MERQGGGAKGLRTYVHVYTHCRGEEAEVMDGASLDQSVAGQSRVQVPLVCSGPTNLGNSLTLDGSKARNDGGACRRTGPAVDETLPFIHGWGGLYRELVLEICLGKDRHMCALESSHNQIPRRKLTFPGRLEGQTLVFWEVPCSPGKCSLFRIIFFPKGGKMTV